MVWLNMQTFRWLLTVFLFFFFCGIPRFRWNNHFWGIFSFVSPLYFIFSVRCCCWTINLWVKVLLVCMHNLLQATEKSLCLFSIGNWTYLTDDTAFSSSVAAGGTLICILTYNVTSEYSIYMYILYMVLLDSGVLSM